MCSIMSDMFSLGMVITAIFNGGKPLIQSNHSSSQYLKQVEMLDSLVADFLPKVPLGLHEAVQRLLCKEPRQRPTSQLLALIKYFADPAIYTLQYLDIITMKDPSQKAHFYRHQLSDVLPYIPKKLWFQHVWPTLRDEMKTQEVLAAALQPIFLLISQSTAEEFQNIILPSFKHVFSSPKSIQASVTLLENLHIILEKNVQPELLNNEILPMLQNAFESTTIQVQSASLISASLVAEYLDETFIRKIILPRLKGIYEKYCGDLKVLVNILMCLEKIIPKLERSTIIEDVLPILCENATSRQDPDIIGKLTDIYRLMLSDNKKYGLSVNLMATRVMPSLLPQTVNPRLHLEQFSMLLAVLQEMLEHIDRNQRNKLKLDHHIVTHSGHGQAQKEYAYSKTNNKGLRHQRSSDNMSIGPFTTPMFVPNVHIENTATLSIGPTIPCQRKTSSAEDMMMRKNSSADNTLMAPKIRLAPSSALSSPGEPLPVRRHSSIGPQERKNSSNSVNLSPPALTRNIVGGSMPNTTGNVVPFSLSGSMSSLKSRRPSMLSSSASAVHNSSQPSNTTGILQQLGSGVVSL
ncbi:SCY1-like protein 2 [Folsomia candida]|uniref:SCY1-like protein 2 n=1 Tax=Folsomia candida TaxID=158441 RepID=A0A226EX52_FOLCA|nr:SCY1-like protein 2 [Folsomia candida]